MDLFIKQLKNKFIYKYNTEYYWQDYNNLEIPDNAIEGGVDTNGNTIFIGQAPYMWTAGNIPASIYQNKRGALTTALTLEVKIETGVKVVTPILVYIHELIITNQF